MLHKELREIAQEEYISICSVIKKLVYGELTRCHENGCGECLPVLMNALADRIDLEYMSCPSLDDGTPIVHGEWYEGRSDSKRWRVIGFSAFRHNVICEDDSGTIKPLRSKWLRKPQPKVLDADGVEIKVGDTVWHVADAEKGTVIAVMTDRIWLGYPVKVEWDNGNEGFYQVDALTHREPDSLEKLRDDIRTTHALLGQVDSLVIKEWDDRLTALIERCVR